MTRVILIAFALAIAGEVSLLVWYPAAWIMQITEHKLNAAHNREVTFP